MIPQEAGFGCFLHKHGAWKKHKSKCNYAANLIRSDCRDVPKKMNITIYTRQQCECFLPTYYLILNDGCWVSRCLKTLCSCSCVTVLPHPSFFTIPPNHHDAVPRLKKSPRSSGLTALKKRRFTRHDATFQSPCKTTYSRHLMRTRA